MRCNSAGMSCVSMHDPTGRRGIWYRTETTPMPTPDGSTYPGGTKVEIVAGRDTVLELPAPEAGGRAV